MNQDNQQKKSAYDIDLIARRGDLRQALEMALEAIKSGVYESDLFYVAADMAYQLGDLDKAEQLVNRLLALDPEQVKGWTLFGEISSKKNEIIKANYAYQMAENLFPALASVNRKIVETVYNEKIVNKAAKNKQPEKPLNFETKTFADICAKQGYYNKALKIYHDLLKKDPDSEELKIKIADIEKRLGRND